VTKDKEGKNFEQIGVNGGRKNQGQCKEPKKDSTHGTGKKEGKR